MAPLRKGRRRRTGAWSRGGRRKATKRKWHFPKRASVEQMVGAIRILLDRRQNFNGKVWTPGRKESFNTALAQGGLTESGAPLAPSSRRTFEALMKYLGFIFMDPVTVPPTIRVTKAGRLLLRDTKESMQVQMLKLQLTNPVVFEACQGILIFPFRAALRMLLEVGPLSYEEIGIYLFMGMGTENDHDRMRESILRFRTLPQREKEKKVREFEETPEGQIILVKAPQVGYFCKLCEETGLCLRDKTRRELTILPNRLLTIKRLLGDFKNTKPYDFSNTPTFHPDYGEKTALYLWNDYFGDPGRLEPCVNIPISLA